MTNVVSVFPASGLEIAAAGYAKLTLQWSTSDGNNLSVTWAVTDGTNSYSVTSNAYGYGDVTVVSGGTYTVTVTHDGTYLGDVAKRIATESTKGYYLAWNAWVESELQAQIDVTCDAGATVTATADSAATLTGTADSSGSCTLSGAMSGVTYTITVASSTASRSTTVEIEHLVNKVTLYSSVRYTVVVSRSTSDDIERCTYAHDCVGWTPFSRTAVTSSFDPGDWDGNDLISGIKPINRSGSTVTDLDKTTLSGVSTSTSADALVHVPTWWLSITADDDNIYISFADAQIDSTYVKYASTYNGADRGYFEFGMFHGIVSSSNLYSYSGVTPTVSTSITNFITYAKARGSGYDIINYDEVIYMSALFVLLFKRTDFQSAVGMGRVGAGSSSSVTSRTAITSFSNDYGMYGNTTSTGTVCFFWIHDFIGNIFDFVGGAKTNSSRQLMRIIGADTSVTESDFALESDTPTLSANISGYVSDVVATSTEIGFFPKTCSGAATTFWCDYGNVRASYFPCWGGYWNSTTDAGPFRWYFRYSATDTNTYIGSRLSYRAPS